jgi:hypothetical protein
MGRRRHGLVWWYWLATALPLAAWLVTGAPAALAGAIGTTLLQAAHFALRGRSATAFIVQVRIAYILLLVAGALEPLRFVHWMQLAGTLAMLGADYCPLARLMSLMPWNRSEPLTLDLLRRTALTPPGHWQRAASAVRQETTAQ